MAYIRRILDRLLDSIQPPAVAIFGPPGVGKTTLAMRRASSALSLDRIYDRLQLTDDPTLINTLASPLLLDEWQWWPPAWDLVCQAVGADTEPGRYLLTSSATPRGLAPSAAPGGIVGLRLRPLTLPEREFETPSISLQQMLIGDADIAGSTTRDVYDYAEEIVASGFPGIRELPPEERREALDLYIDNIINRQFVEAGYGVRRHELLRAWLVSYAAAFPAA